MAPAVAWPVAAETYCGMASHLAGVLEVPCAARLVPEGVTRRPYRLVVLSDHGQSLGATFQARFGQAVEAVIVDIVPRPITVAGTTEAVESAGMGRRIAADTSRVSAAAGPVKRSRRATRA